jgi:hypothetical protein
MRAWGLAVAAVGLALAASAADAASDGGTCSAGQLKATFSVVQGSKTPTVVDYSLRITNRSPSECAVTGPPLGQLVGRNGGILPTHIVGAKAKPLYVFLQPGQSAQASAIVSRRAGPGERAGSCEPVAYSFRLRGPNGSGTTLAPVSPRLRACRGGLLQFTSWGPTP